MSKKTVLIRKKKSVDSSSRIQQNFTRHPNDGLQPHKLKPPTIQHGNIHSRITAAEQAAAHRGIDNNPEQEEV